VDYAIGFPNSYPLDSDLSGGWRYPPFEQLGPEIETNTSNLHHAWENIYALVTI